MEGLLYRINKCCSTVHYRYVIDEERLVEGSVFHAYDKKILKTSVIQYRSKENVS